MSNFFVTPEAADKRYIAHFDILGFKQVTRKSMSRAWNMLSDAEMLMQQIMAIKLKDRDTGVIVHDRVKARIFSDTILLFTLSDSPDDLKSILILANHFFVECLSVCIPIRGGISFGDFFFNFDQNLYCGLPFVVAHELGESAQWMGIVVDDIISDHYQKKLTIKKGTPLIVEWDVPQKNDLSLRKWVINWPKFMKLGQDVILPLSGEQCYESFKYTEIFGKYVVLPPEVKTKYDNTVAFLNNQLLDGTSKSFPSLTLPAI